MVILYSLWTGNGDKPSSIEPFDKILSSKIPTNYYPINMECPVTFKLIISIAQNMSYNWTYR